MYNKRGVWSILFFFFFLQDLNEYIRTGNTRRIIYTLKDNECRIDNCFFFFKNMADKDTTRIPREIQWPCVLYYVYLHFSALIGVHLGIFQAKWTTIFYSKYILFIFHNLYIQLLQYTFSAAVCLIHVSVLGLTAGAHRLWAHASFRANTALRGFLVFAQTLMCQVRVIIISKCFFFALIQSRFFLLGIVVRLGIRTQIAPWAFRHGKRSVQSKPRLFVCTFYEQIGVETSGSREIVKSYRCRRLGARCHCNVAKKVNVSK